MGETLAERGAIGSQAYRGPRYGKERVGPKDVGSSWMMGAENDFDVGSHQPGDLERESILLFCGSHQRRNQEHIKHHFVSCALLWTLIPEFTNLPMDFYSRIYVSEA